MTIGVRLPTDIEILTSVADGKRQTSTNLSAILDKDRRYVTNRIKYLKQRGYVEDPGPAENSRMVEITQKGQVAVFHRNKLLRKYYSSFESLCEHIQYCNTEHGEQFMPDLVATRFYENHALHLLAEIDGLTIPSDFADQLSLDDYSAPEPSDLLYHLYFWSLADRREEMDVYEITELGERYLELLPSSAFTRSDFDFSIERSVQLTKKLRESYPKEKLEKLDRVIDES